MSYRLIVLIYFLFSLPITISHFCVGPLGSKTMLFPYSLVSSVLFALHPQGLTTAYANQILERDGPNELKPPKGTPEYVKFARQLAGGLQCLMWVAACICFIAFGIELARGNLTSFDNVSYISCPSEQEVIREGQRPRTEKRDSNMKQS